ncbi:hypothetical protein CALVIDRAFT_87534 [Calocera viscosa TUFC12733]|uniref:Uncharacterized protein n=1 Tax=Calocera viscosa (strain TUFC12733) TaxID=1330018 RepID=A0A167N6V4_CALVF|nr:hypothetical protein CALVIDRAFT_87534 [Calocera viscosa TUFC12733]
MDNSEHSPTRAVKPKKHVGPPPDPPKSFLPRSGGEGAMYTDHDEAYVIALGKWMLLQDQKVTIKEIAEEVGRRAPHHTASGWNRHVGMWKLFYTEHIYGVSSKEAAAVEETLQAIEAAKKNEARSEASTTRVMRKRPSATTLESTRPRKSHKAIAQTAATYSFPQPTNRRASVSFTHADLQLVVAHIEKNPKADRLDDKLWIRYSEEHPQFTWKEWKNRVRECSELIDHELEIRKQEFEEEAAQEEEEEVDMEIGDSD